MYERFPQKIGFRKYFAEADETRHVLGQKLPRIYISQYIMYIPTIPENRAKVCQVDFLHYPHFLYITNNVPHKPLKITMLT